MTGYVRSLLNKRIKMLGKQNARVGKVFKDFDLGLKRLPTTENKFSTDKKTILQLPFITKSTI